MNCEKPLIEGDNIIVVATAIYTPKHYVGHQNCVKRYNACVAANQKVVSFEKIYKAGLRQQELDRKIQQIMATIIEQDRKAEEKQKERDYETRVSDAAGRAHDEMTSTPHLSLSSLGSADTSMNIYGKCMRESRL